MGLYIELDIHNIKLILSLIIGMYFKNYAFLGVNLSSLLRSKPGTFTVLNYGQPSCIQKGIIYFEQKFTFKIELCLNDYRCS